MRNKSILILAFFACVCLKGFAQNENHNVTGYVTDRWGKPVSGALVASVNAPEMNVATDQDGKFEITALHAEKLRITTTDQSFLIVEADTENTMNVRMGMANQSVHIGYNQVQNLEETTASVSIAYGDEVNKRAARDIGSSLYGEVLGLTALSGSGTYTDYRNSFYVRGLQTLTDSGNEPLILVDGIERDITYISPEEVETIVVLKDAAATAIYGYKGANGAINIVTKRGKYNTREIKFSYDHAFNWQVRRPKFADSYTYANAVNEALSNDGQNVRYSSEELEAFRSGKYPYLYPNVNWVDEVFRNTGSTNVFNLSFRGGGKNFRYYTLLNLHNNSGFIKNPRMNEGYSTQDKYSKANLRTNLDIDLTPKTLLTVNILGTLQEMLRPGNSDTDLWDMIYTVPSAAFPVKTEDGLWGGNSTWDGTNNPVAMAQGAGYTKSHQRALFADMTMKQDLSGLLPGLGGSFKLAYDNTGTYLEDYSRTYVYGSDAVTQWVNGSPDTESLSRYSGGTSSSLAGTSDVSYWTRAFNFDVTLFYANTFGDHKIYSQFKWDYEYRNLKEVDNSWYRQNATLYTHYGYKDRYFADLTLVASAANKLAPNSRWGYSPTIAAAWVLSKEEFLKNNAYIDFMKLRASFGMLNRDNIPAESYWEQVYVAGSQYNIDGAYNVGTDISPWKLGRLPTLNPSHEKAFKYNIGLDATLFKGLNLTIDGYYQRRTNIWVESSGKYSATLGFDAPYENGGIVDSRGVEIGAEYINKIGDVTFNLGANFTLNKNEIKEQYEELRAYDNLMRTGNSIGQIYGLVAEGFFKDAADIASSVPHYFNDVRPGDIKYKDINNDGKVDANDVTAIGYSDLCPEIYYSFKLGAEWKGIGFNAVFQGVANYSAILDTKSLYWPLIDNTNISQHYYDNRWTSTNQNAKYPALSAQSSNNNYQKNTIWLEDRSFLKLRNLEVYYNFPKALVQKTVFMNQAKLYVRGVDLACFDKIKIADPESYGVATPLNRSVVVGLTLGF